jgi:hypothetical protein
MQRKASTVYVPGSLSTPTIIKVLRQKAGDLLEAGHGESERKRKRKREI